MQENTDFLPTPDVMMVYQRWKGLEQWALSDAFWQRSSLGISVSAVDISPKAVLEANWIQLVPEIQF